MTLVRMALGLLLVFGAAAAQAQSPDHYHGAPAPHGSEHYDVRYAHNQYYPVHGAYVTTLPRGPVVIARPGGNYYYSGGVWYRPYGPRFVVVAAPVGAFVPVLPPYYTTVYVAGIPYYYANDTYYSWDAAQNGYEVVAPPGTDPPPTTQSPVPPPSGDDLYVYPQSGQSADQQATDKYECHKWANSQSGFDPTQSGGGVAPEQSDTARDNYQRALRACLEGRGYSVR